MPHIVITKGHDLSMAGFPNGEISNINGIKKLAILPTDFRGVKPKVIVAEGDSVKIGEALFFDKLNPEIKWASPGGGKVSSIVYGPRRVLEKIEIDLDKDQESEVHDKFKFENLLSLGREETLNAILNANIFPIFRQRPFNKIPNPKNIPRDIFVSSINTKPHSVNLETVIIDDFNVFQAGINILNTLTDGKVYLTSKTDSKFSAIKNVQYNTISGPHPAGNVGIQIHHISPLKPGENIWTLDAQNVITLGKLFLNGIYSPFRVISLGGPVVENPGYFRVPTGAPINSIIEDRISEKNVRIVSGDVLTGRISHLNDYLSYYDYGVSAVSEYVKREFIGMLNPGSSKTRYSLTPVFAGFRKLLFHFTAAKNGNHRAVVPINAWERVLPMDILPNELYRSILAKDIDEMEKLGLIECDDEDFALCSFACPSKTDVSGVIRQGLDILEEEG